MLDIHIVKRNESSDWHIELATSLRESKAIVNWVNFDKDLALTHFKAFDKATQPYVGYIDDDDYIKSGSLELLVAALEKPENSNKVAAYSSAITVSNGRVQQGLHFDATVPFSFWKAVHQAGYPHGLIIWRKEIVQEVIEHTLNYGWYGNNVLKGLSAALGDFVGVPEAVLYKRKHKDQLTRVHFAGLAEATECVKEVAYSCSNCRERLGLKTTIVKAVSAKEVANVIATKCCGR
jgi:hypothetical protein